MFTGMPEGGARFDAVRAALAGTRFSDLRWLASTGSTNADVMALARDGEREGVVVVADHQSAGRGRRDRTWVAPPGGSLLVSVLLRPPAAVAAAVTMAAGVALVEAVEEDAGVAAGLKWPNDLVAATPAGERKLAGILAEADWPAGSQVSAGYRSPAPGERAVVVVGVGVNVRWPDVPAELAEIATALNLLGSTLERTDLLAGFLRRLDGRYAALVGGTGTAGPRGGGGGGGEGKSEAGGDGGAAGDGGSVEALVAEWRRRSVTLGRRVRVDLGADDVEGTAVDVTADGRLVVETVEGGRRTLAVGDVVHLRAAPPARP
jgi:BirA family transcriptional regulator, biotin operon repressor / biotin---[acetyl-CoA-carboxylase] ligase